jgi:hypothetical protein
MEVDLQATKLSGKDHGHKRSDLEKAAGELVCVRDTKRPRGGNHDRHGAMGMEMDDSEEEEEEDPYRTFMVYHKDWLLMYGKGGACSFDAESMYPLADLSRSSSFYFFFSW